MGKVSKREQIKKLAEDLAIERRRAKKEERRADAAEKENDFLKVQRVKMAHALVKKEHEIKAMKAIAVKEKADLKKEREKFKKEQEKFKKGCAKQTALCEKLRRTLERDVDVRRTEFAEEGKKMSARADQVEKLRKAAKERMQQAAGEGANTATRG